MIDLKDKIKAFLSGLRNILGVGLTMLLAGILLEVLTFLINKDISIPVTISTGWQIGLTTLCTISCLSGIIWFNRTLDLAGIYLAGRENELVTHGPFNFVRHPLYASLMITLPPLFIIWFEDLVFTLPWMLIYLVAHYVVKIEGRVLIETFGDEYTRYKEFVPGLFPYRGTGGERFRKDQQNN